MKLYPKSERSTFPYWFAHWKAFQLTAFRLGCWKFKYLLHDIEKPWLKWIWGDYQRVHDYHQVNSNHHLRYKGGPYKIDWEAMTIDWECSRLTKLEAQLNAFDTLKLELKKHYKETNLCNLMFSGIGSNLIRMNLCSSEELTNIWEEYNEYRCNNCNYDNCEKYCKDNNNLCIQFKP